MISLKSFWGLRRWTRHSLLLCVAGIIYILLGAFYMKGPRMPNREVALQALLRIAPMSFWGSVFIFAGILSIISSRWPRFAETWGYMVLTGLSLAWGTAYLTGIVFTNAPLSNLSGFLLFDLLGFVWLIVSGLRNPELPGVADAVSRSG